MHALRVAPDACPVPLRPWVRSLAWGVAVGLTVPVVVAQPAVEGSAVADSAARISKVVVYPGVATVERTARISPGQRLLTVTCLPGGLDAAAVQVHADQGVRTGELSLRNQPRAAVAACASPLDGRIQALEDQLAVLQAETTGLELASKYLTTQAGTSTVPDSRASATPANIAAVADALRRSAQDGQVRLHALRRQSESIERALQPLRDERERTGSDNTTVTTLTLQVASDKVAPIRITYNITGPSWQPSYRARLNPDTAQVQLERQALVAQNTGEDWSDVALILSTGRPNQATQGPLPRPWTLDVQPPQRALAKGALMEAMPAAAPAPMARMKLAGAANIADAEMPVFDVTSLDRTYATEFIVPQRISVPSSGQRVTLALGQHQAAAKLRTRTTPTHEAAAYLVASIAPPPGVWPAGPVTLYREGTLVGTGRLDFASATVATTPSPAAQPHGKAPAAPAPAQTVLSFGRDDKVIVTVDPEQSNTTATGITNSGIERVIRRQFHVENRHSKSIDLQVLDASPISRNDAIEVKSTYTPTPTTTRWNAQPGALAWEQPLAAGATANFAVQHTIRHAKDVAVQERRP